MSSKQFFRLTTLSVLGSVFLVAVLFCNKLSAQDEFQPATTVQLPVFGVAVDADGVLQHKQFAAAGGQLFFERARAAWAAMDQNMAKKSPLRKVSLKRLLAKIQVELAQGRALPDDMLKLAGLQRIEYVFAYPDLNDIIIAGPAEGWIENASGRAVGITTGKAVVLLEDLLTAIRAYSDMNKINSWVGCSIGTTAKGRARLAQLRKEIPARVPRAEEARIANEIVPAIEKALGNASVSVFGVPNETNLALILLEADYRMKLIAIGREPPPVKMPVFFDKLKGAAKDNLQRWWFTPNYKCVEVSPDLMSMRLHGQGVQLGTEEYRTNEQGQMFKVNIKPMRASRLYAESFTKKYEKIADAAPVFGQLRNAIDVLVVANYMHRVSMFEKVGMSTEMLLDDMKLSVKTGKTISQAKCMANAAWKGNRLVAPSGGVCILAGEAFRESNLIKGDPKKLADAAALARPAAEDRWWWD